MNIKRHIVVNGDTLSSISKEHNVSINNLLVFNNLSTTSLKDVKELYLSKPFNYTIFAASTPSNTPTDTETETDYCGATGPCGQSLECGTNSINYGCLNGLTAGVYLLSDPADPTSKACFTISEVDNSFCQGNTGTLSGGTSVTSCSDVLCYPETETSTDSDTETSTDTDTETVTDSDTETSTDTDTETVTDSDTDTETETETDYCGATGPCGQSLQCGTNDINYGCLNGLTAGVYLLSDPADPTSKACFTISEVDNSFCQGNTGKLNGGTSVTSCSDVLCYPETETSTDSDTETVTDSDTETVTETGTDSDTETVTYSDTETVTDSDTETVTDSDTETFTDTDTETVTDSDTETSTDTETETSTDTDTETSTDTTTTTETETDTLCTFVQSCGSTIAAFCYFTTSIAPGMRDTCVDVWQDTCNNTCSYSVPIIGGTNLGTGVSCADCNATPTETETTCYQVVDCATGSVSGPYIMDGSINMGTYRKSGAAGSGCETFETVSGGCSSIGPQPAGALVAFCSDPSCVEETPTTTETDTATNTLTDTSTDTESQTTTTTETCSHFCPDTIVKNGFTASRCDGGCDPMPHCMYTDACGKCRDENDPEFKTNADDCQCSKVCDGCYEPGSTSDEDCCDTEPWCWCTPKRQSAGSGINPPCVIIAPHQDCIDNHGAADLACYKDGCVCDTPTITETDPDTPTDTDTNTQTETETETPETETESQTDTESQTATETETKTCNCMYFNPCDDSVATERGCLDLAPGQQNIPAGAYYSDGVRCGQIGFSTGCSGLFDLNVGVVKVYTSCNDDGCSSTPTQTDTDSATPTNTESSTETFTDSGTETPTDSDTSSETYTDSNTSSETYTDSDTSSETYTDSDTSSETYTDSNTSSETYTDSSTSSETYTDSDTSSETYTDSDTSSETYTDSNTSSETYTDSDTSSETYTDSNTSSETYTDSNTSSETYTDSNTSSETYTDSDTSSETYTDSDTSSETYTDSNTSSETYTDSNTSSETYTDSNTSSETYTDSNTSSETYTDTDSDTETPTDTETETPTCPSGSTYTFVQQCNNNQGCYECVFDTPTETETDYCGNTGPCGQAIQCGTNDINYGCLNGITAGVYVFSDPADPTSKACFTISEVDNSFCQGNTGTLSGGTSVTSCSDVLCYPETATNTDTETETVSTDTETETVSTDTETATDSGTTTETETATSTDTETETVSTDTETATDSDTTTDTVTDTETQTETLSGTITDTLTDTLTDTVTDTESETATLTDTVTDTETATCECYALSYCYNYPDAQALSIGPVCFNPPVPGSAVLLSNGLCASLSSSSDCSGGTTDPSLFNFTSDCNVNECHPETYTTTDTETLTPCDWCYSYNACFPADDGSPIPPSYKCFTDPIDPSKSLKSI